jgi:hypothetical protein
MVLHQIKIGNKITSCYYYGSNMNDSNNNDEITGDPESNSVYYSAASSSSSGNSDDSNQQQQFAEEEQEVVVMEEVNFEGRREHQQEFRRRETLDPLTDFIVNGNMLLEEAGSDDDANSSVDELHQNNNQVAVNQQQSINNNIERDDAADRAVREQLLLLLGHDMIDNDGDSSSSDDDDAYNIQQNQINDDINSNNDDATRLLARDHAYLPTAQPLYPEKWIAVSSRKRSHRLSGSFDVDESNTEQSFKREVGAESIKNEVWNGAETSTRYEIGEPPDANNPRPTIQRTSHLSPEDIEEHSATKSVLAIMEVGDVVLFPGSTIPLRVRDPVWVNYVGTLIDDARGLYGSHSGSAGGMGEVQIGILPRISRRRTRRRSSSTSVTTRSQQTGGRMGRWRIDLIRRGVASIRRPGRRRRDGTSTNNNDNEAESDQNNAHNRDNDRDEESEEESSEDEYFHPARSAPTPSNPFIGRIGTMATITFTHEEAATSTGIDDPEERDGSTNQQERPHSRVWQRHRGEIVVSALGTKRFRIIAPVNAHDHTCQDRRYNGILFEVEEMSERLSMPPSWMLRMPGDFRYPIVTQSNSHVNAIWNLSLRSSLPVVVYQSIWPWRVAQKICNLIQQTEQYQGIKEILSSAGGIVELGDPFHGTSTSTQTFRVVDPSAFADWLSSNLPLSQNERLDLLEMGCRASQLKYLLKKIEKDRETVLRCKCCAAALSPMRHVFTVKGAEGTTGHYVNEV